MEHLVTYCSELIGTTWPKSYSERSEHVYFDLGSGSILRDFLSNFMKSLFGGYRVVLKKKINFSNHIPLVRENLVNSETDCR